MAESNAKRLSRARFEALESSSRPVWNEASVREYHEVLDALERAWAVNLSHSRIRDHEMRPVSVAVVLAGRSGRTASQRYPSANRHCPEHIIRDRMRGVRLYLQPSWDADQANYVPKRLTGSRTTDSDKTTDADNRGMLAPGGASCDWPSLSEDHRKRVVDAEEQLAVNLRAHESMRRLVEPVGYRRVGGPFDGQGMSEEVPKLARDIGIFSETVLQTLAEASWPPSSEEELSAARLEGYGRGILNWALGKVDKRDLPLIDVTSLWERLAEIVSLWAERAQREQPSPWTRRQANSTTPDSQKVASPAAEVGSGRRERKRDASLQQLRLRVRALRDEDLSHQEICERLGNTGRPPRASWRGLSWPVAYKRHTAAVTKWLSDACS